LLEGGGGRKVNLTGTVVEHSAPDRSITAKHNETEFKGRQQCILKDQDDNRIQINIWGAELIGKLSLKDRVLVMGARTSDKYGVTQLNINPVDGKLVINPKGHKQLTK
jgi:hypothetical protein